MKHAIENRPVGCWRDVARKLPSVCILGLGAMAGGLTGCRTRYAERPEIGTVALTEVRGRLELTYRGTRSEEASTQPGGEDYRTREDVFEERLRLETDGYLYHPNLVAFGLGGLFGLVQQDFNSNFEATNPDAGKNGTAQEYDANLRLLQAKPYPGNLFARRARALVPQTFRPSVERTSSRYGLLWRHADSKLPLQLQLERSDVDYDQLGSDDVDWRQREGLARLEAGANFTDENRLSLTYEHRAIDQKQAASPSAFTYKVDEARLDHQLQFGAAREHDLGSNFIYYDQTGAFGVKRLEWRERLRLKLSESVDSRWRVEVINRRQGNPSGGPEVEELKLDLSGSLEHRLYQSLVSNVGGNFVKQDFKGAGNVEYGLGWAGLDYRKTNFAGVLTAGPQVEVQRTDNGGSDQPVLVNAERHTFTDPAPVILGEPDIILSSIVITNEARTVTYQEGLDYSVLAVANRVEIHRNAIGRIANGQTVLIDYAIAPRGAYQLDRARVHFRIRQDCDFGLAPYYRLEWQGEALSDGGENVPISDDFTTNVVGLEFRSGPFEAKGEFEDRDASHTTSYAALRLSSAVSRHFAFGADGRLYAIWSRLNYDTPDRRRTTTFDAGASYHHPIAKNLSGRARVLYRFEDDTIRRKQRGVDVDVGLEWRFRNTTFSLTYDFSRFDTDINRNTWSMLYLQVVREF